jgi:AcrR family transcriptional regulator
VHKAEIVDMRARDTRQAILDATAVLVAERGLHAVTMPLIAAKAGIAPTEPVTIFV